MQFEVEKVILYLDLIDEIGNKILTWDADKMRLKLKPKLWKYITQYSETLIALNLKIAEERIQQ